MDAEMQALAPGTLSLYEHVRDQLSALIALLGLESAGLLIARSYELICRESLAFPRGQRPLRASRVNADGTPFQFSLTLGASGPRLQFLSETGAPHQSNSQRLAADRTRIRGLAPLFGAHRTLSSIESLVEQMAPGRDRALLADDSGATWIGAGFSPAHSPKFKIYVNAKWGEDNNRWARLATFASQLGVAAAWREVRELVDGELEPLGVALVTGADAAVSGRIYLSGYGKPFAYLEALGGACGGSAFKEHLRRYGRTLLREDRAYPTRSVVCSLGIRSARIADFKVEFCGHCAFDSDVQAKGRCVEWLRDVAMNATVYQQVVELLSGGALSPSEAKLHAYVGVGSGHGAPDSTFYLNPAATS